MKILFLGVISATLTSSVFAAKDSSLDISIGQSYQTTSFNGYDSTSGQDFFLGIRTDYRLIENLKLELSFNNYQESKGSYLDEQLIHQDTKIRTTSVDLGFKYGVNLVEGWTLYGHLGVSSWKMNIKEGITGLSKENSRLADEDLYYSISLDYDHNENDAFGLEYKVIDIDYAADNIFISNKIQSVFVYFKTKF
jgi:hypothetical protein